MPPLAMDLPVKQKFRTWMKILLHYVFLLNSSKSDDLRTNALSTSTKCKNHEKKYFDFVAHHCRDITRSEDKCIFYL